MHPIWPARQLSSLYQHHDQFVLSFGCKSPHLLAEAIGSIRLAGSLMSSFWQGLICFILDFIFFPEGRLEDTELSQKFSPFFKLQRWSEKKLVERGRICARLLWLMRLLCRTWISGAFLSDFFTNLGYILTFCIIVDNENYLPFWKRF